MNVLESKKAYNKLLGRFYKANEYFENEDVLQSEKEKQLKNYQVVLKGLNYYLGKVGPYKREEVLKGFSV